MKKIKISLIVLLLVLVTGCGTGTLASADGVYKCKREGEIENGTTSLNYKVYYEGDYVTILESIEEIRSDSKEVLDTYEKAYRKIFANYDGLEYYENTITRDDNSVTSTTSINYAKIDIDKLLEIEGSEGNPVKDGKLKVVDWMEFAKKYGVVCDK